MKEEEEEETGWKYRRSAANGVQCKLLYFHFRNARRLPGCSPIIAAVSSNPDGTCRPSFIYSFIRAHVSLTAKKKRGDGRVMTVNFCSLEDAFLASGQKRNTLSFYLSQNVRKQLFATLYFRKIHPVPMIHKVCHWKL